jgi:hypothetical protein
VELGPIIAVQDAGQTRCWPRQINPTFAQPSCFVVDGVKKSRAHRNAGRRFKGEVKSCDHSSADVDRDRQHRPPNWASILLVDDDNIDNRVVDLPYRVRTVGDKLAWAWGRRRLQIPRPLRRAAADGFSSMTRRLIVFRCGARKPSTWRRERVP